MQPKPAPDRERIITGVAYRLWLIHGTPLPTALRQAEQAYDKLIAAPETRTSNDPTHPQPANPCDQ